MSTGPPSREPPPNLRLEGRLRVLTALADGRPRSRAELSRSTGLARATVGSVLADLDSEGLVGDAGTVSPSGDAPLGRPARAVALRQDAAFVVGVDIARDHLRCVLCDLTGTAVHDTGPIEFDIEGRPRETLDAAADLVRTAAGGAGERPLLGVGVGIASPVDRHTGALRSEGILPGWTGVELVPELGALVPAPVGVVNDANAGLLAESRLGAAHGVSDVVYVRLSAGIGAGVISDGRVVTGAGGLAGELGHVTVRPDGLICRCGNRGCLETVASPQYLARLLTASFGRPVSSEQVVDLLRSGHRGTARAVAEAGEAVGQALAHAVMILNPALIVVGGELAEAGEVLFTPMRRAIEQNVLSAHAEELTIVPGRLGDAAGVLGAASLVLSDAPARLAALLGPAGVPPG
ncbi:ROK family protein [Jatrophihabitans sp. YIM 134969]